MTVPDAAEKVSGCVRCLISSIRTLYMFDSNLPTIEEWLAMEDWYYIPSMYGGVEGEYHWIQCPEGDFADALEFELEPKVPFRLLATYWDVAAGAPALYRNYPGWKIYDNFAICNETERMLDLNFSADAAVMVIDHPVSNEDLLSLFKNFVDFNPDSDETERFWDVIRKVRPYCYLSNIYGGILVARGKELYESVFNEEFVSAIIKEQRRRKENMRKALWNQIGPECGPEKCTEKDCDRLRIQLAVRCFLHQINCGWKEDIEY